MKLRKVSIKTAIFITLAVVTALLMTSCFFFPEEEPLLPAPEISPDEVTYVTFTARRADIVSRTITTGYITSRTVADCFFTEYTGNLKAVYPRPGDFVEAGDLIAELDVGELVFELETARLQAALAQLTYNANPTQEARLNLELAENTHTMLQARMDGAQIFAPMSGQVSFVERLYPGEEINPHRVIVRIIDPDDLLASASVSESNAYGLGDEVEIHVGDTVYPGIITYTPWEARADGADDVNIIRAEFTGESATFSELGRLADIVLIRGRSENAVIIPRNLIRTLDGRTFVQVFEDGIKREADVVTGISNATEIEIISGLEEGDKVVVR